MTGATPDSFKGAKEKARSYSTAFIQLAGRVAHFDVQLAKSINGIRARAELGSGGPYAEIGRFKAAIGELSMRWPSATHYAPKKTHDAPRNAQYGDGDPHPAGSYQHDFYDKDAVG